MESDTKTSGTQLNIAGASLHFSGNVEEISFLQQLNLDKYKSPTAPAGFLTVTVADPVKVDDKAGAYTTFQVVTHTDRPEYEYREFSSVRRFKDFVWLYDSLSEEFPGAIIPPLPPKSHRNKFEENFLNARVTALQKFLTKLASHPELSTAQNFKAFLAGDETVLTEAKAATKQASPPIHEGFLEGCGHLVTAITCAFSKPTEDSKSPLEIKFEEMAKYIHGLEIQTGHIARHADSLVRKSKELGLEVDRFGTAFFSLGQKEQGEVHNMLINISKTSTEVSFAFSEQATREAALFQSPVYEYLRHLNGASNALEAQEKKRIAFIAAVKAVEAQRVGLAKLIETHDAAITKGEPGVVDFDTKKAEAVAQVQASLEKADRSKGDYESAAARCIREIERFQSEQGEEIRKIVSDFVGLQVQYTQAIGDAWSALLPTLGISVN